MVVLHKATFSGEKNQEYFLEGQNQFFHVFMKKMVLSFELFLIE